MENEKTIKVIVKKDHISKVASGSPELALAELIWNSFDADASKVHLRFLDDGLKTYQIIVEDDGTGINFEDSENLFVSLGGSWKAQQTRTPGGRFLHGREGKGRFKGFALGTSVEWNVHYKKQKSTYSYTIRGDSKKPDEFKVSQEKLSNQTRSGVKVVISDLSKLAELFNKAKAVDRLTPIFALYLCNYPKLKLCIEDTQIAPDQVINDRTMVALGTFDVGQQSYDASLEIIEWITSKEKEIWFCDKNSFPLEMYKKQVRGIGDYGFSAYISSNFFEHLHEENQLSLGELNPTVQDICNKSILAIKKHFKQRSLEKAKDQIQKWKDDNVYPYEDEANKNPIEEAERKVFDILALNVNEHLNDFESTDKKTKKFQFRMLRQALEKNPEELQTILTEVLQLPQKKQEELAELLKETSLSTIISASKLVSDRLKFLSGLELLVFDPDFKKVLKERSQLHRIIAENTWIFGDAFSLSVDDKSLTEVLRIHKKYLSSDIVINDPVKRLDGKVGIVDLMLSRSIPRNHHDELEHLVVELKAPKVTIGQKEINQIEQYAFAVANDERFLSIDTNWHFWVISNKLDPYATMKAGQENYERGVIHKSSTPVKLTIWVKTWSELMQENKHRLKFLKDKLQYNIDREESLDYLRRTYSEYTQGVLTIEGEKERTDEANPTLKSAKGH